MSRPSTKMPLSPLAHLWLLALPLLAHASASWNFTINSEPSQCQPVTLSWSGGSPPHTFTVYSLSGAAPDTNLSAWSTGATLYVYPDQPESVQSTSFTLPFAENATVLVVGSDSTGFASGGTSVVYNVLPSPSDDSSCLSTGSPPNLLSHVVGWTYPAQSCELMAAAFSELSAVTIQVLIPGGDSFALPSFFNTTNATGSSAGWLSGGFWTMPVPEGTEIAYHVRAQEGEVFVSGLETVLPGNSTSCLQIASHGTTGSPYAGAVQTSTAEPDTSSSGTGPNVGAIVGGVIGGVAGLVLLMGATMFLMRRYNKRKMLAKRQSFGLAAYDASKPQRLERATWPEGAAGGYKDEPGPKGGDV